MMDKIPSIEILIRLGISLSVFAALASGEAVFPRRKRSVSRSLRWLNNLGMTILDALVVRIVIPTSAVGFAVLAESRGWGLLNHVPWPVWLEVVLAVVLLDLAIYGQHVLFHFVPVLWRFHRMHHADLDVDVTTGTRFHPIEVFLSFGIKFAVVVSIGASPVSVLIFEILLNATSLFNHSNVRLPERIEPLVRLFVVTPDMHRVHHSIVNRETNSNFGFNLPWWDWLVRTYRPQPQARSEEHTSELQSRLHLVCRLLLEKKKKRYSTKTKQACTTQG